MKYLRKIIREEIEKSMGIINTSSNDDIIYNNELGRQFANNTLQVDINNLNTYDLTEYIPKSISQEIWSFDFVTAVGENLIITISKQLRGGKAFWTLLFGELEKGQKNPNVKYSIENIEGYENFIDVVNKNIANNIDTSKY